MSCLHPSLSTPPSKSPHPSLIHLCPTHLRHARQLSAVHPEAGRRVSRHQAVQKHDPLGGRPRRPPGRQARLLLGMLRLLGLLSMLGLLGVALLQHDAHGVEGELPAVGQVGGVQDLQRAERGQQYRKCKQSSDRRAGKVFKRARAGYVVCVCGACVELQPSSTAPARPSSPL